MSNCLGGSGYDKEVDVIRRWILQGGGYEKGGVFRVKIGEGWDPFSCREGAVCIARSGSPVCQSRMYDCSVRGGAVLVSLD